MVAEDWSQCRARLDEGIRSLGFDLPVVSESLILYLKELAQWNQTYNLTAVRDPLEMVSKHLLDSLAVLPHLHGSNIIDVGSGAGLPGIPLALADSTIQGARRFTLLDSNGKKAAFMRHAVRRLGLKQVEVVHARAEDHAAALGRGGFDSVLSRAFSSLAEMLELAGPLCALHGRILAMKGQFPQDELEDLRHAATGFELEGVVPLSVPGLAAERHLVLFSRA
ncbi:MAG: 16S rRNA (guanine(527)-N(7))-methyltransferase RsmG [Nevskiales bacterium]